MSVANSFSDTNYAPYGPNMASYPYKVQVDSYD
jgi:hypothetical protein